ncbi:glycine cleavage system H protein [Desulfonatronum thiosulfatophilum]|uniref:Glycine cleavage system H protein n=1 Tax=Desulfonatronum thiosulfatophilum TaxID=617002 RepID=A0A1G6DZS2_9BACT|nr:glycine cleavage system protein GcvH [Desulfonatronum thiosulfatophilum]SDB50265.1 glycine cleavage system H protein [Desulfonatronum thiosulfatophilum]
MIPDDLLYSASHEWARIDGQEALVGITDFAQCQLGDITFIELPSAGDGVAQGREIGSIESVKAATELNSPVTGTVLEVNEELDGAPEKINRDPYGAGWMIRVKLSETPRELLTSEQYKVLAECRE